MEDSEQSREHGIFLLLHRRKRTADMAKSGAPGHTAKGARNVLLYSCPAQAAFDLIVGKLLFSQDLQLLFCHARILFAFPFFRGHQGDWSSCASLLTSNHCGLKISGRTGGIMYVIFYALAKKRM
jgi:hypothetical protein